MSASLADRHRVSIHWRRAVNEQRAAGDNFLSGGKTRSDFPEIARTPANFYLAIAEAFPAWLGNPDAGLRTAMNNRRTWHRRRSDGIAKHNPKPRKHAGLE
jgi:hypothetical protein